MKKRREEIQLTTMEPSCRCSKATLFAQWIEQHKNVINHRISEMKNLPSRKRNNNKWTSNNSSSLFFAWKIRHGQSIDCRLSFSFPTITSPPIPPHTQIQQPKKSKGNFHFFFRKQHTRRCRTRTRWIPSWRWTSRWNPHQCLAATTSGAIRISHRSFNRAKWVALC